jgi:hypothetical protein
MGATAVFDMAAETPPAMKSLANETASIGISTIFRSIISEFIFIKKKITFLPLVLLLQKVYIIQVNRIIIVGLAIIIRYILTDS